MSDLDAATDAIRNGDLVVYPTETVYGLGADALDPDAVSRVFETKGRPRDDPISLAVPSLDVATRYVVLASRERAFAAEFLPGPVTLVCRRRPIVPDELTGGRDRVGVRIPDHDIALALLSRVAPVTATSANRSGQRSVVSLDDLDPGVRSACAVLLDGGRLSGTESTVVDVADGVIHRRGALADDVDAWLSQRQE